MEAATSELTDLGPEDAVLFLEETERIARECRRYPWEFFSFVMPNPENPGERMVCQPHQRLMMEFILHHRRAVLRCPTDSGKTQALIALLLWLIGHDPSTSSIWGSKTESTATRPLGTARNLLEDEAANIRVRAVFPRLRKSPRAEFGDAWGKTALTVDRDPGSIDPTITALGLDTAGQGRKVRIIIGDDLLDWDNTLTVEQRKKVDVQWESRLVSRLVPDTDRDTYLVFSNVPWHREDQTFRLQRSGYPTLHMDIEGNIALYNVADDFETDLVRPSKRGGVWHRLTAHDPDPEEQTPLVPIRWPRERIEEKRSGPHGMRESPNEFARSRMCNPRSDEDSRCKESWIDKCKALGEGLTLVSTWDKTHPMYDDQAIVITGEDLGFGDEVKKSSGGWTAFFTFALLPDLRRVILDVYGERGMTGPDALKRSKRVHDRFGSTIYVESNAAQKYMRQFAKRDHKSMRIRSHFTTKANKQNIQFGVETLFDEFEAGLWVIPSIQGAVHPEVQKLIDDCLFYQPPPAHTGDYLMAAWIAQYAVRHFEGRGKFKRASDLAKKTRAIRASSGGYRFRRGPGAGF